MDPKTPKYWAELLWNHFRPLIASGNPVYLTVNSELLRQVFEEADRKSVFTYLDTDECFNSACLALLRPEGKKAEILPRAFQIQENGFSCAIVLAAQQVLVVQEMVSDEHFSHDAYFPRYHEKIGLLNSVTHSNPFRGGQFIKVWDTLAQEISSVDGASQVSVTFKKGSGRKNLNRNFPISQALFSLQDLIALRRLVSSIENFDQSSTSLMRFFYRNRWLLTRRARRLIQNEVLQPSIYEQFRGFLSIPEESLIVQKDKREDPSTKEVEAGNFIVALEESGFREAYFLRYRIDFDRQFFGKEMWPYLDKFSRAGNIFILTEDEEFSGYSNSENNEPVREGDSFILFYRSGRESEVKIDLDRILCENWQEIFTKIEVGGPPDHIFLICEALPQECDSLFHRAGRLIEDMPLKVSEGLTCDGGLLLNKSRKLYLKGYPPQEFFVESVKLTEDTVVDVNNKPMTISSLIMRLALVEDFEVFLVEYKGFKIEFCVGASREIEDEEYTIGFNLIDSEHLNPLAGELLSDCLSLRGWLFSYGFLEESDEENLEFERFEIAWLMREIDSSWIPTSERAIEIVLRGLAKKEISDSIRKYLEDRLTDLKILPAHLICRHKILESVHAN